MLNEYPFLLLASTLLQPTPSSTILGSNNIHRQQQQQQQTITESQKFYQNIVYKCLDEQFMPQMNLLLLSSNQQQKYLQLQSISKLRQLCNYHSNFLEFLIYDYQENLSTFCNHFEQKEDLKILENFFWLYHKIYNNNLKGLIPLILVKMIHYSKNSFNDWFSSNETTQSSSKSIIDDHYLIDYAICNDLISYGVELHQWIGKKEQLEIDNYHQWKQKFTNLLVLMGDHCFVKMMALVVVYKDIGLYNCYTDSKLKNIEGAFSLCTYDADNDNNQNNSNVITNLDKIIQQFEMIISTSNTDTITSKLLDKSSWSMTTVNYLLSYCYLTYGFQLSFFISELFHKYGLNEQAKKFAIEFGHNLGMAIKLSHLLDDSSTNLINIHQMTNNENIFFESIPIEIRKKLFQYYIGRAKQLYVENIIQRQQQQQQFNDRSLIIINLFGQYLDQLQILDQ
ncbi:hypothetical protein DERP_008302 [Dermatophagoides pteronyssinus]|uniref:Uncharacterized protein n=1 Tax=Dermatophagoides pteronyssinus TaxID=6956 RepID=A0ABQ8J6R3_DERPT|nr:hypothetical protein DERP_008302 [Dermatophagoides pteronyssinus]